MQDPQFNALVKMMEEHIRRGDFTPSEMRMAAVLASIHYESRHLDRYIVVVPELEDALATIKRFVHGKEK